ncbi:hypothetical protein QBC98_006559 [Kitasatospora acidiphila]
MRGKIGLLDKIGRCLAGRFNPEYSGECGLPLPKIDAVEQGVLGSDSDERVVLGLHPNEFGFQVQDALLQPPHLGEHSRVGAADVPEKRLCHDEWSSTLSDRTGTVQVEGKG